MNRLTYKEPNGDWGIVGMTEENADQKMYAAACKLLDYEETGLGPDEIERKIVQLELEHCTCGMAIDSDWLHCPKCGAIIVR